MSPQSTCLQLKVFGAQAVSSVSSLCLLSRCCGASLRRYSSVPVTARRSNTLCCRCMLGGEFIWECLCLLGYVKPAQTTPLFHSVHPLSPTIAALFFPFHFCGKHTVAPAAV